MVRFVVEQENTNLLIKKNGSAMYHPVKYLTFIYAKNAPLDYVIFFTAKTTHSNSKRNNNNKKRKPFCGFYNNGKCAHVYLTSVLTIFFHKFNGL